jgi:hypothetical protein
VARAGMVLVDAAGAVILSYRVIFANAAAQDIPAANDRLKPVVGRLWVRVSQASRALHDAFTAAVEGDTRSKPSRLRSMGEAGSFRSQAWVRECRKCFRSIDWRVMVDEDDGRFHRSITTWRSDLLDWCREHSWAADAAAIVVLGNH